MGNFLKFTEIKTKITSLITFFYIIVYLIYIKQEISLWATIIFFLAMFIFDLTTTAINNYIDTKTNDQKLQFTRKQSLIIIYILFLVSMALGLYLVYLTDIVVFLAGGLCFVCGVFYTYGPIPISRMPIGEIVSGLFYGLIMPFILLYINMPKDSLISLVVNFDIIELNIHVLPIIKLVLLAVPPICTTANIMLANNICDIDRDIKVKRYTLPYYLGKNMSLYLYAGLYYVIYIVLILMVILRILNPITLLFVLTFPVVQKHIRKFLKEQNKEHTFNYSIKNFILIMGVMTLLIFISNFIR